MTFRLKRPLSIAVIALFGLLVIAGGSCASPSVEPPTAASPEAVSAAAREPASATRSAIAEQTATPAPSQAANGPAPTPEQPLVEVSPAPAATATAGAGPAPRMYDRTDAMYRVFSEFGLTFPTTSEALEDILREKDTSQVAVLIESIRFMFDVDTREEVASTLRALTGQEFDRREWDKWMEWLGRNLEEYQPPDGYAAWKVNLLSGLDSRYADLLADAEKTARIDLTEVVWGGVVIDGIPDLRDPNIIPADEADYLGSRERVFGVSINGQHRAYPLRITNPHEMVNDTLGGEPIALAW